MQNLREVVDGEFIKELLRSLEGIGVRERSVRAIFIEGSAVYLEHPNDIDFKVIVEWRNPKAETGKSFNIKGYKVECTYYSLEEWNRVDRSARIFYYVTQGKDMILAYGTEEGFKRFDVVNDRGLARKVLGFYEKYLFAQPKTEAAAKGRRGAGEEYRMPPKRLWNFLLFAYKILNGSQALTAEQLARIQDAHDLKVSVEEYRGMFEKVKELIESSGATRETS